MLMPHHKEWEMNQGSHSLVSVIIPCFNDGEFLPEALESLDAQSFRGFEVLVINDGSTDPKTLGILESICTRFPSLDLKVISQENQGPPGARNRGVLEARGDWVVVLDADDKLTPDYLAKTLALAREENLDFVTTDIRIFGAQDLVRHAYINLHDQLFANRMVCTALFNKRALMEEPYDPAFRHGFEDWELWIRLLKNGYRGEVIHEPLFLYRRKAESRFTKTHMERSRHIRQIRQKHAEFYRPEQLAKIRKNNQEDRNASIWLHEFHYRVGLHFPMLASVLMRIYLALRPFMPHRSR